MGAGPERVDGRRGVCWHEGLVYEHWVHGELPDVESDGEAAAATLED